MHKDHLHPLKHLAIIMDGNNRWAKERGLSGTAGHEKGAERIRTVLDSFQNRDIDILTLFAFSSENWNRSPLEVRALMSLFASYLKKEAYKLAKADIQLIVIGSRKRFSPRLQKLISDAEQITCKGKKKLILAADYGGQWDIMHAAQELVRQASRGELCAEDVTEERFQKELSLGDLPMPDMCIRTGGDQRISNFLLWQLAYAELYFTDCYWPDFDALELEKAIDCYYSRQRRFGLSAEQSQEPEDTQRALKGA